MTEIDTRNVRSTLILLIGIVLLSNGAFGFPQIPQKGWVLLIFGLILLALAAESIIQTSG